MIFSLIESFRAYSIHWVDFWQYSITGNILQQKNCHILSIWAFLRMTPLVIFERWFSFTVCESKEIKVNTKLFNVGLVFWYIGCHHCACVTVGSTYVAEWVRGLTRHPVSSCWSSFGNSISWMHVMKIGVHLQPTGEGLNTEALTYYVSFFFIKADQGKHAVAL